MRPGQRSRSWRIAVFPAAFLAFVLGLAAPPQAGERPVEAAIQIAQSDAAEVSFWESVRDSGDPDELRAYLDAYPEGHFAALARRRLQRLGAAERPAAADPRALASFAYAEGLSLLQAEGPEAALPLLQIAVARDPTRPLYLETLADAYAGLASAPAFDLAIETYRAALAAAPGRRSALEGLRVAALLGDRPLIALEATEGLFRQGDAVDLNYLPAVTALWILLDRPQRGLASLAEALPHSADPASVRLAMAALHRYRGDAAEVARLAAQVLAEVGPESGQAAVARSLLPQDAVP